MQPHEYDELPAHDNGWLYANPQSAEAGDAPATVAAPHNKPDTHELQTVILTT